MINKIYLDAADRQTMETILGRGLGEKSDLWRPARLALARSLQMPDPPAPEPSTHTALQGRGVELHAAQFTGEGKGATGHKAATLPRLASLLRLGEADLGGSTRTWCPSNRGTMGAA